MMIKINYSKVANSKISGNIVLFVDDKFTTVNLKKYISTDEISYINDLLKNNDIKKNIFTFEVSSKKNIILISIKKKIKNFDIENLGAEFHGRINREKNNQYILLLIVLLVSMMILLAIFFMDLN